jgi:hypothetical protein
MDEHALMPPVVPVPEIRAGYRRRADLRFRRVLLALTLAPLLGASVMAIGFEAIDRIFDDGASKTRWGELALTLLAPSLWSLLSGISYLQTVTRIRDRISWTECLFLGSISGFLLPIALRIGDSLLRGQMPVLHGNEINIYAIMGLIALPFGLVGGLVLWLVGVRPAPVPLPDAATVFD